MNPSRPVTVTIAIVLFLLMAAFGLFTFFSPGGPPPFIRYYGLIVGVIGGLIAVVGLWLLKRWGLWLTIGISAATILLSVPGLVVAPTGGKVISAAIMVACALVLVLMVLPATRQAFAPESARTLSA